MITASRWQHILGVARKAKSFAMKLPLDSQKMRQLTKNVLLKCKNCCRTVDIIKQIVGSARIDGR